MEDVMNMDLSLLKKIRCRFLDQATGQPIPGVIASLSVAVDDATRSAQLPVATLCTDATGYMSFDLKPMIDLGLVAASGLYISAPKFGLVRHDLIGSLVAIPRGGAENKDVEVSSSEAWSIGGAMMMHVARTTGEAQDLPYIVFPIYLENRVQNERGLESASYVSAHFPSIQSPDVWDYKASPYSFVTPSALKLDNDGCEILLPSSLPIQRYRFHKVIVHEDNNDRKVATKFQVQVIKPLDALATDIKFGEVLEYRQDWFSLGHSLGEIKYSLPLAPGESTQLAVIEWSRNDVASRTDNIRATEFLDHDSRRERAIEDTVEAALREEQGGNSHMGSTSGTGGGTWGVPGIWGAGVTGNHAFGGGISYSYGNRNVEGESLQDLHDRVRQTSSFIRSLNSTVIVQASQTEKSTLQTRRVANHNHCHALTIQYYEVLRHYLMQTTFSGRRKAVLIPFALFKFDWEIALRFRTVLEQTLLDPSLGDCFEALIRLNLASSVYDAPKPDVPATTTTNTNPKMKDTSVKVTGKEGKGIEVPDVIVRKGDVIKVGATGWLAMSGSGGVGSGGVEPIGDSRWNTNQYYGLASQPLWFLAKGLIAYSLIYKIGTTGSWQQGNDDFTITVKENEEGKIFLGVNNLSNAFADFGPDGFNSWTVNLQYPVHETDIPIPIDPSKDDASNNKELPFRKSDDLLCAARLLTHLNSNQGFYNSAVWTLLDAVERRLYLEAALKDRTDILYGMDDKPIAISGNHVAFEFSGPLDGWSDKWESDPKAPIEDIVTLPTRGLFAEAQMGHCNSCEKRDVTRMWDWTEMTTETPPDISGISPGPRGQIPSITQGQLPANVIQITQPQAAPDPTGLANALSVLKTPDIFRDMAGLDEVSQLLGELAKASGDANTKAMATLAQQKVDGMKRSTGGAGTATSSASQTPEERYDNLQVAKEVAKAAQELGWDEQKTSSVTSDIVSGEGGGFYSTIRRIVEDAIKGAKPATMPTEHKTLAEKAKTIADQPILVKAYEHFQAKTWKWWFSPNDKLNGAVSRPADLNSWSDWDNLRWQHHAILTDVAGLNANSLARNTSNLTKLEKALTEWPDNYYAVFQSGTTEDTNTCNLFLGDALTLDGRAQLRADGKYYSAQQIYQGEGGFREITLFYVSVGDVACWGGHVEIVTGVNYADGTFCSRGGGRTTPPGSELCEEVAKTGRRKLDYPGLRFMRVA
jgi:hypothetical protein